MSQVNIVEDFIQKVQWIHEVDYGDFKRKLGLYINRMEDSLSAAGKPALLAQIEQLRVKVIYNASGNIEDTRDLVLELAEEMKAKLH